MTANFSYLLGRFCYFNNKKYVYVGWYYDDNKLVHVLTENGNILEFSNLDNVSVGQKELQ